MNRARWLAIAVALAAAVALVWWWRGRGDGTKAGTASGGGAAGGSMSQVGGPGGGPAVPGGPRPSRPLGQRPEVGTNAEGTRTYTFDNAVIRDHRGSGGPAPLGPPGLPPDQRTMSSEITAQIYDQLKPIVRGCGDAVAAGDRGPDPFAYVTLTVGVAEGALTTSAVHTGVKDVGAGAEEAFVACVQERAMKLAIPQTGEPDRQDYIVQYPIRLR